jgi:hypothetical protein
MKTRNLPLIIFAFTLSACSSLNGILDREDTTLPVAAEAPPAAPASQPGTDDAWCQRVAASERQRMQISGYDAATLDRMTLRAYQQCRTLDGRAG